MINQEANYQVSIEPLVDIEELAPKWKKLESKAKNEFFLSWLWIETWLKTYSPKVKLVTITINNQIVALALLAEPVERRHKWLYSNVIRLHQTGSPQEDQIWIEYNDLLADSNHIAGATKAFINFLIENDNKWDELIIGATIKERLDSIKDNRLHKHTLWEAPCYGVDLKSIRDSGKSYLDSLSRNTRYQIRRAYRAANEQGKISYSIAQNQSEAIQWFDEIGELHKQRWGEKSGFNNKAFINFHQALIKRGVPAQSVQLFRVEIAEQLIGCLYNFIYKGKVYFYLSGISYDNVEQLKPGFLCHVECINAQIEAGNNYYDFMGGNDRYKRSLGSEGETLQVISFQRDVLKLKLEQKLRRVKGLVTNSG